jgi:hypothetical protein
MTFEEAKQKVVRCSGIGIRRPCWEDKSLIITGDKHLRKWTKKHPNKESTIMQPEESALNLINDLRNRGLLN